MLLSLYNSLSRQKRVLLIIGLLAFLFAASGAAIYLGSAVRNARDADTNLPGDTNVSKNKPGSLSDNRPNSDDAAPSGNSSQSPAASGEGQPAAQPGSQPQSGGTSVKPSTNGTTGSGSTGSTSKPTTPASPTPTPTPTPTCPSGQTGTPPNCVTPPPKPIGIAGNWALKFQDEFNGSRLKTNVWATQRGEANGSYGDPYNPQYEDAFYVANNPKVTGGNLVLTLNKGTTNGYPYSSGMVQNGRSFSYKYGYTEARVKVPGNAGVWPAYWTLASPIDKYWPPEIDIFEFGMEGNNSHPWFNYHYGTYPNNGQFGVKRYGNAAINYTQDFHTYGMLWRSNIIQVYIDGQPGPSYTASGNITSLPQYLIFNLGLKKGANVPSGTSMLVDYVRVWQ